MDRITSLDELNKIEQDESAKLYKNPKQKQLIEEALNDSRCIVLYNQECNPLKVIVSIPSFASRNKFRNRELYGLYIAFYNDDIGVWFAARDGASFIDSLGIGEYSYNMSLDEIITAAMNDAEKCDYCHKKVGIENLSPIAFAGKSCPDCKAFATKKDMGPGWCN